MKRKQLPIRLLFILPFLSMAFYQQAQVMWACNDPAGGIQIWFDYNQNCPNSPGSLAGLAEIGFHSGANGWASVVAWDDANATTGVNVGNDTFLVDLPDPNAYYGTATTAINFVFNQGTVNTSEPWGAEGKEDDGMGGCLDFFVDLLTITETCPTATSVHELLLRKELTIYPNPLSEEAVISFENDRQENYDLRITNSFGQLVEQVRQFNGDEYVFHRNGHAPGFYFVTLTNEQGQFFSGRMMIE